MLRIILFNVLTIKIHCKLFFSEKFTAEYFPVLKPSKKILPRKTSIKHKGILILNANLLSDLLLTS